LYASIRRFRERIVRFPLSAPIVAGGRPRTLRPPFVNCLPDFKIRFSIRCDRQSRSARIPPPKAASLAVFSRLGYTEREEPLYALVL